MPRLSHFELVLLRDLCVCVQFDELNPTSGYGGGISATRTLRSNKNGARRLENFKHNCNGLIMNTGFAGMNCSWMAVLQQVAGMEMVCGMELNIPVRLHAAGDKNSQCRKVLMSHTKPARHCFGPVENALTPLGQTRVEEVERMNDIDRRVSFEVELSVLNAKSSKKPRVPRDKLEKVGTRCLDRLIQALLQPGSIKTTSYCYACTSAAAATTGYRYPILL
jgi:hypothetical protein